jgi:hypothetical protein
LWIPDADDIDYYVTNLERTQVTDTLRPIWTPQDHVDNIDTVNELSRILSQQIAQEIDNEIIDTLTRRINGGNNDNWGYIRRWMEIGNNRA